MIDKTHKFNYNQLEKGCLSQFDLPRCFYVNLVKICILLISCLLSINEILTLQ